MAEYDLIKTVSQYFDYHLVNPFLEFIATKTVSNFVYRSYWVERTSDS